jgi:hypothetical protein
MSVIGGHKHNATGRSTGARKVNSAMKIAYQFVPLNAEMLDSPAYRVLSLSGHRVLTRVQLEFCRHGGSDNGKLIVTFRDFTAYGIERHSIAPAIAEVVALGFLRITHKGRAGNASYRSANQFMITHLPMPGVKPFDDWRKFLTDDDARAAAVKARLPFGKSQHPKQDIDSGRENPPQTANPRSGENPPQKRFYGGENPPTCGGETPTGKCFLGAA